MMKNRILILGLVCGALLSFQPQAVYAQNLDEGEENVPAPTEEDIRDYKRHAPSAEDYEARNKALREKLTQQMNERAELREQQEKTASMQEKAPPPEQGQPDKPQPEKKRYIYTPQNESTGQGKLWNTY